MRTLLFVIFITIYLSKGYAATEVDERRVEEEKRRDLKTTEAQFHDSSKTTVDQEPLSIRDFLANLSDKDFADHRDAAQVLAILLGKEGKLVDFKNQRDFLVESGLLPSRKTNQFIEEAPLRKGLFAQILLKALGIKGGLTMRIVGPFERYCLAELVYEDMMIPGSTGEWMSGRELVYAFIQASHYISKYKSNR